jgi:hypothetical protein
MDRLLSLLTRTKPLYHAALAMSSFYIQSILLRNGKFRNRCISQHYEAMRAHHSLAFQELQLQIASLNESQGQGSLKDRIEIVACIIQLISFEVCLDADPSLVSIEPFLVI